MVSLEAINMPPKTGSIHRCCLLAILGALKSAMLPTRNLFHRFSDYYKICSIIQQMCMSYLLILRDIACFIASLIITKYAVSFNKYACLTYSYYVILCSQNNLLCVNLTKCVKVLQ